MVIEARDASMTSDGALLLLISSPELRIANVTRVNSAPAATKMKRAMRFVVDLSSFAA
jgi:hypothetical protein